MIIKSRTYELCFADGHCVRGLHEDEAIELFERYAKTHRGTYLRPENPAPYKAP